MYPESFKIVELCKFVNKEDAEALLNNLPITIVLVRKNSGREARARLEVYVDGTTIKLYPPSGTLLVEIAFDTKRSTDKIHVSSIVYGNSGLATFSFRPRDIGINSWAGYYGFQRESSSIDRIELAIYKQPKNP